MSEPEPETEQEQLPYVVCVTAETPHHFTDDVDARCAFCGCAIYHRPSVLRDMPDAITICLRCLQERTRGTPITVRLTETTKDELDELVPPELRTPEELDRIVNRALRSMERARRGTHGQGGTRGIGDKQERWDA